MGTLFHTAQGIKRVTGSTRKDHLNGKTKLFNRREKLGQLPVGYSKEFSKKIIEISKLVPPEELEASMKNLETEIKRKLAEMD